VYKTAEDGREGMLLLLRMNYFWWGRRRRCGGGDSSSLYHCCVLLLFTYAHRDQYGINQTALANLRIVFCTAIDQSSVSARAAQSVALVLRKQLDPAAQEDASIKVLE
jgi:hypothetical protein